MKWLDIFCFISVARTHSFSVSARELMISQQAVSRHIQNLEEETGLSLFLRNYHEVHLTKAGERMLQCLLLRENMVRAFKEGLRNASDVLRVGWSQWLGCPEPIRQRLRAFCKAEPDLTILTAELSDRELQRAMREQRLDLLLTTSYIKKQMEFPVASSTVLETPLYLLESNCGPGQAGSGIPETVHITAPAGNEDLDTAYARVRGEYARMGLRPAQIELADDPRSVYLNVLLKNGVAFTTARRVLTDNPRFFLRPMDRTVTVVLCRAFQPRNPHSRALEDFLLRGEEGWR